MLFDFCCCELVLLLILSFLRFCGFLFLFVNFDVVFLGLIERLVNPEVGGVLRARAMLEMLLDCCPTVSSFSGLDKKYDRKLREGHKFFFTIHIYSQNRHTTGTLENKIKTLFSLNSQAHSLCFTFVESAYSRRCWIIKK